MKEDVVLAGLGGAIGLAGALAAVGGLLYGVAPIDPATLAAVSLAVALVTLLATGVPAWRASRVDPTTRCEQSRR